MGVCTAQWRPQATPHLDKRGPSCLNIFSSFVALPSSAIVSSSLPPLLDMLKLAGDPPNGSKCAVLTS